MSPLQACKNIAKLQSNFNMGFGQHTVAMRRRQRTIFAENQRNRGGNSRLIEYEFPPPLTQLIFWCDATLRTLRKIAP